jgi:tetratricopeptide (TPR) repeat protein
VDRGGAEAAGEIPATLSDLLTARLDRLGSARAVAQLASVLGREFSRSLLAVVSTGELSDLDDAIAHLEEQDVLQGTQLVPEPRFMFSHALVQQAAYDSLLLRNRRELHSRVAAALLAEREPRPELIAHHWTEAGRPAEALELWREAATQSLARSAYVEGAAHLESAIAALLAQESSLERNQIELELQLILHRALQMGQGFASQRTSAAIERARELSESIGDSDQRVSVLKGIWSTTQNTGDIGTAAKVAEEIRRAAESSNDTAHLLDAHLVNAGSNYTLSDMVGTLEHARDFIRLSADSPPTTLGFSEHLAHLYAALASLYLGLEDSFDEHIAAMVRELDRGKEDVFSTLLRTNNLSIVRMIARDLVSVVELTDQLSELAERFNLPFFGAWADIFGGWAQTLVTGEPDGSDRVRAGIDSHLAQQQFLNLNHSFGLLAECQARLGRVEVALGTVDRALGFVDGACQLNHTSDLHRLRAELLARAGASADKVESAYAAALELARRADLLLLEVRIATSRASWLFDQGRANDARAVLTPTLVDAFSERVADGRQARVVAAKIRN